MVTAVRRGRSHQHPDVFGRVTRFCPQLGVTPVFVAPYEFGLQHAIEHFNGLYTAKVWRRFHYSARCALIAQGTRYLTDRLENLGLPGIEWVG